MNTLFSDITVVLLDGSPVLEHAYVGITDGKICYVGQDKPETAVGTEVIDGRHKVLMPGLVNAHTHVPMTLLRGFADDYTLLDWLHNYIFPAEDKLTPAMVYQGARLGLMEALASGTVSVTDMYSDEDQVAKAVSEIGMKANICRALISFDKDGFNPSTDSRIADMKSLVNDWHGHDGGRIAVDASIHAEYTSHDLLWRYTADYAHEKGIGMHVHVSESKEEHENCKTKYGKTPTYMLNQQGVFNTRTTVAHGVWLEPDDMEILADHRASVAHNPVSNLKLASGCADVRGMLKSGINVAIGTDGVSSNNSHDMFEEIKTCALFQKYREYDPTNVNALQALNLAITNGALSQGRQKEMGKIAVGYDADLVMLDFDKPHLTPCHHTISNIVYAAKGSDVVLTMVRGKTLYKNGEFLTIDAEKVMSEVRRIAKVF